MDGVKCGVATSNPSVAFSARFRRARSRIRAGAIAVALMISFAAVVVSISPPVAHALPIVYTGTLRPAHNTSVCLDVPNPSGVWPSTSYPASGTHLQVWGCHGNQNQSFQVELMAGEVYRIKSAWSGQCLEIADVAGADSINNALRLRISTCVLPQTNRMRQAFVLTRHGAPQNNQYQIRPAMNLQGLAVPRCLDVTNSGGGGSYVEQWTCDMSSVGQANHIWTFTAAPEGTNTAMDGQRTSLNTVPSQVGLLTDLNGNAFCSASTVSSNSGTPDWVLTAKHCVDTRANGQVWFKTKYDGRASPNCASLHIVDLILLAPSTTSQPQDTALLKLGGSYSCSTGAWVGQRVHHVAGFYNMTFGAASTGATLYTYGYPSNLGAGMKIPVACANPHRPSGSTALFRLTCESGPGASGSPYLLWGTNNVYATSNGLIVEDIQWQTGSYVRVPAVQQHFWHSPSTQQFWSQVT